MWRAPFEEPCPPGVGPDGWCVWEDEEWFEENCNFAKDWGPAGIIANKVKDSGYEIELSHTGCPTELWDCCISRCGENKLLARESGETAPEAICRAALAVFTREGK